MTSGIYQRSKEGEKRRLTALRNVVCGKKQTQEHKDKMVTTRRKNNSYISWHKNKKLNIEKYPNYGMKGKKHTKESKIKCSLANKGKHFSPKTELKKGKQHPNWKGGLSFEPYSPEFNNQLKEEIRQRDSYRCQECFRHQDELRTESNRKYKLHIHHYLNLN